MAVEVGGGSGENSSYDSMRDLGSAKTECVLASSLILGQRIHASVKGWEFFFPHLHHPPPKVSFKELDNRVAIYEMLNHSWKCKNMEAPWFDKSLRYMCVCVTGARAPPMVS